jgi:hypothetical protein
MTAVVRLFGAAPADQSGMSHITEMIYAIAPVTGRALQSSAVECLWPARGSIRSPSMLSWASTEIAALYELGTDRGLPDDE